MAWRMMFLRTPNTRLIEPCCQIISHVLVSKPDRPFSLQYTTLHNTNGSQKLMHLNVLNPWRSQMREVREA